MKTTINSFFKRYALIFYIFLSLGNFWKSYFNILSISSYSDVLFDIQKGLEALGVLLNFVADNLTGGKDLNQMNFTKYIIKIISILSFYSENKRYIFRLFSY